LAAAARDMAGRNRRLTLARYALLVEAAHDPSLRVRLAETGSRVNRWFATWLRIAGSADPERDVHVLGNYLTGLVLHELAVPDPDFDPTEHVVALVESLLGG
ncbi:MAG: TetR/AcrR family transcriptional regulator, partial [Nonomuraea sp.]|nr:TetR/AcrR family transcriptional regulator [Nonomuraea sp.]